MTTCRRPRLVLCSLSCCQSRVRELQAEFLMSATGPEQARPKRPSMVYIQGRKSHIRFMKLENAVTTDWKRVVNVLLCPHSKLCFCYSVFFGSGSLQVLSLGGRPLSCWFGPWISLSLNPKHSLVSSNNFATETTSTDTDLICQIL